MKEKIYTLGPDLGNAYTDCYAPDETLYSILSLVAPGRVEKYQFKFGFNFKADNPEYEKKDKVFGDAPSVQPANLFLQDDTGSYFVGKAAYKKSDAEKIRLSHDSKQSLSNKRTLLRTAMGLSLPTECKVKLVLGHPYSEPELADDLVQMAKGVHEYNLNGQDFCQHVIDVAVWSQPIAAFVGAVHEPSGAVKKDYAFLVKVPTLVIDIGGGTLDVCWIEFDQDERQFVIKDANSGSTRKGMWYVWELVQGAIEQTYGVTVPLFELDQKLSGGRTELNIAGEILDVSAEKELAFAQGAADIMTYVTNLISTTERKKIGKIFSTGGTTYELRQHLEPAYLSAFGGKHEIIRKDSIVLGQTIIAKQMWGDGNE